MLFQLTKLFLVVLSAIVLKESYTPPLRSLTLPPQPTLKSPWPVWREYMIIAGIGCTTFPIQRVAYMIVTLLESIYILSSLSQPSPHPSIVPTSSNTTTVTLLPSPSSHASPIAIFGLLVGIAGGVLRISAYRALGKGFTYEIPDVAKGIPPAPKLVTTGPYDIVRHPSYTGLWMIAVGLPLYHLSSGSWVVESGFFDWKVEIGALEIGVGRILVYAWVIAALAAPTLGTMRAGYEDVLMKKAFGSQWELWRTRVKYRVIPWVY
ncbi:hypothetical protein PM082_016592 [Marasmius tenuissimus]|nr:hypothetical protein PM082_016592 [Marasmius tenuissimus]